MKGQLTKQRRLLVLRAARSRLFDALWRRRADGQWIPGPRLAAECGVRSVNTALVEYLHADLKPFGLAIVSAKGKEGGYRLISVGEHTDAPVSNLFDRSLR